MRADHVDGAPNKPNLGRFWAENKGRQKNKANLAGHRPDRRAGGNPKSATGSTDGIPRANHAGQVQD
jgi:hypothetical protein